jgi:uncharacterized protein YjbI with pentapeptide repeats
VRTEAEDPRTELRADCSRCVGLCCVALPFARSADFAIDKPAGVPCVHLRLDDRCGIHDRLRGEGFPGCAVFDCFGAGQQVVQVTFGGRTWREGPEVARPMFEAFETMRAVHEMRWYLADARSRDLPRDLAGEVRRADASLTSLSAHEAEALATTDVGALRRVTGELLGRVSAAVRAGLGGRALRGVDLVGRDLCAEELRGADLRGGLLIGADLRGADLRGADLLGTDLRAADLSGADLTDALFVTGPQLAAAGGDASTRIPEPVRRPSHWG